MSRRVPTWFYRGKRQSFNRARADRRMRGSTRGGFAAPSKPVGNCRLRVLGQLVREAADAVAARVHGGAPLLRSFCCSGGGIKGIAKGAVLACCGLRGAAETSKGLLGELQRGIASRIALGVRTHALPRLAATSPSDRSGKIWRKQDALIILGYNLDCNHMAGNYVRYTPIVWPIHDIRTGNFGGLSQSSPDNDITTQSL